MYVEGIDKIFYKDLVLYCKIGKYECYPPREDSFILAKYVEKFAKGVVLDIGTGSGIHTIISARKKEVKKVFSTDIDEDALIIAKINSFINLFNEIISKKDDTNKDIIKLYEKYIKSGNPEILVENFDKIEKFLSEKIVFIKSDLFKNVPKVKFDTIIINPPYLPEEGWEDEKLKKWVVGGKQGYELIERFFHNVNNYLSENGVILMVFSSLTGKNKVLQLAKENNLNYEELDKKHFFFEDIYCYLFYRKV